MLLSTMSGITIIFIVCLILLEKKSANSINETLVNLEMMWAVIDTFVSLLLFSVGMLTVYKLCSIFGSHFSKEALFVTVISVFFCFGYMVHGVYDWIIYHKHKEAEIKNGINKIWCEWTWLSIIRTLMPILTIYLMHYKNFSTAEPEEINESDSTHKSYNSSQ